jgi:redox-regulated HSP33 family molecular chaperone
MGVDMMIEIICTELQANQDVEQDWDRKLKIVDALRQKYDFEFPIKELLYEIMYRGYARTVVEERAVKLKKYLTEEGYQAITVNQTITE